MRYHTLFVIILVAANVLSQEKPKRIGEIEFFGYPGIDLSKVKAALPFREGDEFSEGTEEEKINRTVVAVKEVLGHPPTDVSVGCCDRDGDWTIFIGLAGKSILFNTSPKGGARLPRKVLDLYERFMDTTTEAVLKGAAGEDRSRGYALSAYPPLRAVQLEMRAYAVHHETLLRHVLETSSEDQQRAVAAQVLGYARQSKLQISALVRASRDSKSLVRNNATRALLVLAESNPRLAVYMPTERFVELLLSGTWTDLNKASLLLLNLTKNRDAKLLAQLRKREVLERLIEIARWRTGHADAARYILGRISGIDESRLRQLVEAGSVETIIDSLK